MNGKKVNTANDEELSKDLIEIRLSLIDYAAIHTLDEFLTYSLDKIGALLSSPIGFYHFVEPDQRSLCLQQWSTNTLKKFCRAEGKGAHYSIDKAGVWVDCVHQKKAVIHNDYASLPYKKGMPEGHAKLVRELVVPVIRNDKVVAVLGVGNKSTNYTQSDSEIVSYFADVTWTIVQKKQVDEALKKATVDLEERVKELNCLYSISKLVEEDNLTLDEIFQRTVDLIPPSWQYPEITCAQIKLGNRSHRTKQFNETKWVQSQPIRINRKIAGFIEVYLLDEKIDLREDPFLKEERHLLNVIAERLGHIIEHKRANEALQKAHNQLQAQVDERTKELAAQNLHLLNEIQERKNVEKELHKSSEKIKLFAYSVAHDLKNPAIATYGLAKILKKKFANELTDKGEKICEQIRRSSEDIASLVDKINIFISTKETPLKFQKLFLQEILLILQEEFSLQLNLRSIGWVIKGEFPDYIIADRHSILRIFRNIIGNSLKYGGDNLGKIEIGYESTDDLHIFTITDDGHGLEEGSSNKLFNWFERNADSTKIPGAGMGLAIVKEIAALHYGEVWYEATASKGATFCVSVSKDLMPIEQD